MQYAPTRVRAKPVRFHISPPEYTKNAPRFTLPNKDTPKSRPVLGLNLRRGYLRGVCNTPLHGYVQNLTGFTFPHLNTPKTRPVLDPNLRRGLFRGVCNTPLHGYVQNLAGLIFPHMYPPKKHPISPFPIRIRPKPARFYTQILGEGDFEGRMQYAPTWVHRKMGRFHISAHDMTRNPAGFGLCHTTWRETRRVLDFATRHGPKPGGFWTLPLDMARNPAGF